MVIVETNVRGSGSAYMLDFSMGADASASARPAHVLLDAVMAQTRAKCRVLSKTKFAELLHFAMAATLRRTHICPQTHSPAGNFAIFNALLRQPGRKTLEQVEEQLLRTHACIESSSDSCVPSIPDQEGV